MVKCINLTVGKLLARSSGTSSKFRILVANGWQFLNFVTLNVSKVLRSGRSKQLPYDRIVDFTIQPTVNIDPPFGTDKSVPYEWMEHFTIQPTVS